MNTNINDVVPVVELDDNGRMPVVNMTDRELLEEIAENMRMSADAFAALSDAMKNNKMLRNFLGV